MKQPIKFLPYLSAKKWGGRKISDFKGLSINCSNVGESWELSALPGRESIVADGDDSGMTLSDLVARYRGSLVGESVYRRFGDRFPFSVKLVDAHDCLSLQVHTDDELLTAIHDSSDKADMVYMLGCDPEECGHGDSERIASCQFFSVSRENVSARRKLANDYDSFMGLICIRGDGKVRVDGVYTPLRQGETMLLPAPVSEFDVEGQLSLLTVVVPERKGKAAFS